jgi:hypothetical protein
MSTITVDGTITVDAAHYARLVARELKAKISARRATVKNLIYVQKAKEAKITVTKAEVDKYIKDEDAKKAEEVTPVPEA